MQDPSIIFACLVDPMRLREVGCRLTEGWDGGAHPWHCIHWSVAVHLLHSSLLLGCGLDQNLRTGDSQHCAAAQSCLAAEDAIQSCRRGCERVPCCEGDKGTGSTPATGNAPVLLDSALS